METLLTIEGILNLLTLTTLEIVLGIDNVIFIAIIIQNLPASKRTNARIVGLSLALILRVLMLFGASWIIKLTTPLFTMWGFDFSGRTLLLIIGGLFLIGKSILEIIELFEDKTFDPIINNRSQQSYWKVIFQIIFVDLILSFDSIITAIGMTDNLFIIIISIIVAIIIMILSSKPIGEFIYHYPSLKVVALCFIILVGIMLVCNGFNIIFPKAYLYLTMLFSMVVEIINILLYKKKV